MALQPIMIILGIIFMRYFQFAHSFFMWKIILCNLFQEHLDFPVANATIGYLIARPKVQAHKAPQRVCLIYTNLNDTYFWTVDPTSCPRKIKPGVAGIFKFNTTKIGIFFFSFPFPNCSIYLLFFQRPAAPIWWPLPLRWLSSGFPYCFYVKKTKEPKIMWYCQITNFWGRKK